MSDDKQEIELFDKYIANTLSETEKEQFEERLATDTSFEENFMLHKKSVKSVRHILFREDVLSVMQEEELSHEDNPRPKLHMYIAAAVSLVLASSIAIFYLNTSSTNAYDELYKPYPNIVRMRATDPGTLTDALDQYARGNFGVSLKLFSAIPNKTDTILFYQGLSQMSIDSMTQAITTLKSIPIEQTIFTDQIHWYLGLAYFKTGDVVNCRSNLRHLQIGGFKYAPAQLLLKDLD